MVELFVFPGKIMGDQSETVVLSGKNVIVGLFELIHFLFPV